MGNLFKLMENLSLYHLKLLYLGEGLKTSFILVRLMVAKKVLNIKSEGNKRDAIDLLCPVNNFRLRLDY